MARIYVSTYAKYSAGRLHGAWIDVTDFTCKDDFIEACKEFHKDEHDPELMFQDHEDCAGFVTECSVDSRLWDYLELDSGDREVIDAWVSENLLCPHDTLQNILDQFCGRYDSLADWAEESYCGENIPESLQNYIDWESMGRDMGINGSYVEHNGEFFIF